MENYKAPPEQWADIEHLAKKVGGPYACFVELRAKIESLEEDAVEENASTHFVFDAIIKRIEALETKVARFTSQEDYEG